MIPTRNTSFFKELGFLQNQVRNLSADLNLEMIPSFTVKEGLYKIWGSSDSAMLKLHTNLQKLEGDISFFFTENGCRRVIENRYHIQSLLEKFFDAFRLLSNEYLNIKLDNNGESTRQRNHTATSSEPINQHQFPLVALPN